MNKQRTALAILALLIAIKFVYLPWSDWVIDSQAASQQLKKFDEKQQQVIDNETLIHDQYNKHRKSFDEFIEQLPTIKSGDKANTLWFSLIDTIKAEEIKVYNQRIEFEEYVTDDVGYVTGTFSISGNSSDVMQAVLQLEAKAPYVFLEQLKLTRSQGKKSESLVVQLYLRYWFTQINKTDK
ncbi:MAG: hypothetical protein MJK12_15260 [Colwellia sp.]|nr:hypothetical protein [Colwellia sp.]